MYVQRINEQITQNFNLIYTRVVIGVCRVCWWLLLARVAREVLVGGAGDALTDSYNNNSKHINNIGIHNNIDTGTDIDIAAKGSMWEVWIPSLSSLHSLAVLGMAGLQLKAFLQTVHLAAASSLGAHSRHSGERSNTTTHYVIYEL